jgi:hypothetical protein
VVDERDGQAFVEGRFQVTDFFRAELDFGRAEREFDRRREAVEVGFAPLLKSPVLINQCFAKDRRLTPFEISALAGRHLYRIRLQPRFSAPTAKTQNLLLDAAFHSPATMACLSASLRSRVDAPGLHLQSRLKVSLSPFGFSLLPPTGLFLPFGAQSTLVARCQVRL